MERIVVGRSATLTQTFTVAPTGTPTVVVKRSDGTTVSTGSVTGSTTTWSYTIPASSNTLLDTYTETWTAVQGGEAQTYVDTIEVVGGYLVTLAEARAVEPLNNTAKYPDADLRSTRTEVERAIEDEYGTALVPRFATKTLTSDGSASVRLNDPVRAIRSVTVAGVALSSDQLALLASDYGFLTGYCWPRRSQVVIGYEYGLDEPPARIKRNAPLLLRQWLVNGPIDDRASTFSAGAEGGTYSLLVPGRNGSIFGLPDLDAAINASPYRVGVA